MFPSQNSNPPTPTQTWKQWDPNHFELQRFYHTSTVFDYKILLVGGLLRGKPTDKYNERAFNLALIDPETQKFKIIPSNGNNLNELCWAKASACYWKDSKLIVFGGYDFVNNECKSSVAIVTLKDLDSETPSASWEKFETTSKHCSNGHSAFLYQGKMLVTNGLADRHNKINNIWFLDLESRSWKERLNPFAGLTDGITFFHQNTLFLFNIFKSSLALTTFGFETQTFTKTVGPEIPDLKSYLVCPQLVEGKIYFIIGQRSEGPWPLAAPWSYDIESQKWTEIPASPSPFFGGEARLISANNQLILCGGWVGDNLKYGEIWSLPLNSSSKPSQIPQTSTKLTNTQQIMQKLLKEAPYADISFEVESQIIPAHKWWLCKKSKYFANMFASGMVEAQASKITISDMTASTFQAFLEFLYVEHVDLNNTLALELLQQADKYSVPELAKACEKYLAENLTPENYVVVSQMAEMLDIVSLKEASVNYIAKNIKQLRTRKDFEEISDSILRESIVKFIVK